MDAQQRDTKPSAFFKYCAFDPVKLRKSIVEHKILCPSPRSFNDPYDCYPIIDPSGSPAQLAAWARRFTDRKLLGAPRAERRRSARQVADTLRSSNTLGDTAAGQGGINAWMQMLDQMGVCSLSVDPLNLLMWAHYARSHSGVVLEFGGDEPPFDRTLEVRYSNDRPRFRPLAMDRNQMKSALLQKAVPWQYEQEWRYITPGKVGWADIGPRALTGIILGADIAPEHEAEIRAMVSERGAPVQIDQMWFYEHRYEMLRKPSLD
jgi:hypothetical protein